MLYVFVVLFVESVLATPLSYPIVSDDALDACKDRDEECAGWKESNFCETYKDLMSYYCSATCEICGTNKEVPPKPSIAEEADEYKKSDTGYVLAKMLKDVNLKGTQGDCSGDIKNGKLNDISKGGYGYTECNEGYELTGDYYVYCDEQGTLAGDLPTCDKRCNDIKVNGGDVTPVEGNSGWLFVTCLDGKSITGDAWIWCTAGEVEAMPTCSGPPGSGTIEPYEPNPEPGYKESSYVDPSLASASIAGIVSDVLDVIKPDTGKCKLQTVPKGTWSDPYGDGTYWFLTCEEGTILDGVDYMYCDESGDVFGAPGQCLENKCVVKVKNGEVSTEKAGEFYLYAQVTCNEGYTISGVDGTYCAPTTGELSTALGTCEKELV